ncbi:MAG TPA: type II secretion system-associated lipoprotein [Leptospiraceae bacterium]|nr:type II secretion system-associated lipoprotein [Leptospiraceae bacterium]HNN02420.1 type II secretion system-associated lipoprotein [Leptospiraceae bacterium]
MNRILLFSLLLLAFQECQRKTIKKDDLALLNEEYSAKTYYLKQNFYITHKDILPKGTSVKIWIETSASLIKIKCYPSNQERESAIGKMVAFIIQEELKDKPLTSERLDSLISEKLEEYSTTPNNSEIIRKK